MKKDQKPRIIIVGAGIGGLTAAASLLKRGFPVRVYEQAPALGEIGAGIQSSANAVKVLYDLGLREELEKTVVRPLAFEFRRFDTAEMMHRIPLGPQHEQANGAPYFHIHRADLHELLAKAVLALDPDCIALNARAEGFDETAAGAYPERAVRIIVPFAAGATLDLMTRAVAEELAHQLGQPVVVENRAGASGIIGADAVAKAPADGYTLMMAPFSVLAVNASLHKNLPYDNLRDLAPVALVAVAPHVLLASAQLPYRTLGELLAAAKARPGQIAYASAGAGSSAHLATEVLLYKAGTSCTCCMARSRRTTGCAPCIPR